MTKSVLGLDIGGANLKLAHSDGSSIHQPFPLWKQPEKLHDALFALLQQYPKTEQIAVTMTGELCDCFETKSEGVSFILDALTDAAGSIPIAVWYTAGDFFSPEQAKQKPLAVAAANWHGLATFVAEQFEIRSGLLIDIGSTTTDIIPMENGQPNRCSKTDFERLHEGSLIYTGVRRTPICALGIDGLMAEFFATTLDAYLLLGKIPEDPTDCDTADHRPATREKAHYRLARMFGSDGKLASLEETRCLADKVHLIQCTKIGKMIADILHTNKTIQVVFSGSGEFLAQSTWEWMEFDKKFQLPKPIRLSQHFAPEISTIAPAYAIMKLGEQRL